MQYISHYNSPLGEMLLVADEIGLVGVWFDKQKYFARALKDEYIEKEVEIFSKTKEWLDIYFSGKKPKIELTLHLVGSEFQKEVWSILLDIPYGKTMSYGDIAKIIAKKRGLKRMSAQAVGGAVGRNNLTIIVPCHRVIGSDGSLTGYAGGIDRKIKLLELENKKRG